MSPETNSYFSSSDFLPKGLGRERDNQDQLPQYTAPLNQPGDVDTDRAKDDLTRWPDRRRYLQNYEDGQPDW